MRLDRPIRLDRAWIERHIPHQGGMCLLEEVVSWDEDRIRCRSVSHRAVNNPLRARGRLGIACGIEYAAQTMAVHGALTGGALEAALCTAAPAPLRVERLAVGVMAAPRAEPSAAGMLAALRDVEFHAATLDGLPGDLLCGALRVAGDSGMALYEFELSCAGTWLLRGRATVLLQAQSRIHP
jgi:predicted hotdog family 3-hydroxylacyl-ACP dehydratase